MANIYLSAYCATLGGDFSHNLHTDQMAAVRPDWDQFPRLWSWSGRTQRRTRSWGAFSVANVWAFGPIRIMPGTNRPKKLLELYSLGEKWTRIMISSDGRLILTTKLIVFITVMKRRSGPDRTGMWMNNKSMHSVVGNQNYCLFSVLFNISINTSFDLVMCSLLIYFFWINDSLYRRLELSIISLNYINIYWGVEPKVLFSVHHSPTQINYYYVI